jgi:hypothetical protein
VIERSEAIITNEVENFLKLAKLEFLDDHREDFDYQSVFDAFWYGVEWLLRQAIGPDGIEELSRQAQYTPEEYRASVNRDSNTEMSLGEAMYQQTCATFAIELIRCSKFTQTKMVNDGLAEFIHGRLVPTERGAEEIDKAGKPFEMLDIRFDNVGEYKRAIRMVAQLVRGSPDISDEEVKAKVLSAMKSRNRNRRRKRPNRRKRRRPR